MTAPSGVESRPTDWLLRWLSARGRASRPTVDRACRAIAESFDPRVRDDRPPTSRYVEPLRRLGHIEEVKGGLAVVPTTFCWTRRGDRGLFVGARDGLLLDELRTRFGPWFDTSHPEHPWPATWCLAGEPQAVAETLAELGIAEVHEPGMRLLSSLPTLEDAIAAWPDAGGFSGFSRWEVAANPGRGHWALSDEVWLENGLVRPSGRGRRAWMILRDGVGRLLDSAERRAVAWWAELARLGRPRLVYDHRTGFLRLPGSLLPPPAMVERPLIWASGEPPRRHSSKGRTYKAIEPERAAEVARVLGLRREDA
jgi:hypothetical protein